MRQCEHPFNRDMLQPSVCTQKALDVRRSDPSVALDTKTEGVYLPFKPSCMHFFRSMAMSNAWALIQLKSFFSRRPNKAASQRKLLP